MIRSVSYSNWGLNKESIFKKFNVVAHSISVENLKTIADADLKGLSEKDITFLDLQNSYINNLIRNNIPINLIAKQIGLASTDEFVKKYGTFIDEKALEKFDIAVQLFVEKV